MSLWGGGAAWWRVIHADGSFLPGHEREALAQYREEGAPPLRGAGPGGGLRVDMRRGAPGGEARPCRGRARADRGHVAVPDTRRPLSTACGLVRPPRDGA